MNAIGSVSPYFPPTQASIAHQQGAPQQKVAQKVHGLVILQGAIVALAMILGAAFSLAALALLNPVVLLASPLSVGLLIGGISIPTTKGPKRPPPPPPPPFIDNQPMGLVNELNNCWAASALEMICLTPLGDKILANEKKFGVLPKMIKTYRGIRAHNPDQMRSIPKDLIDLQKLRCFLYKQDQDSYGRITSEDYRIQEDAMGVFNILMDILAQDLPLRQIYQEGQHAPVTTQVKGTRVIKLEAGTRSNFDAIWKEFFSSVEKERETPDPVSWTTSTISTMTDWEKVLPKAPALNAKVESQYPAYSQASSKRPIEIYINGRISLAVQDSKGFTKGKENHVFRLPEQFVCQPLPGSDRPRDLSVLEKVKGKYYQKQVQCTSFATSATDLYHRDGDIFYFNNQPIEGSIYFRALDKQAIAMRYETTKVTKLHKQKRSGTFTVTRKRESHFLNAPDGFVCHMNRLSSAAGGYAQDSELIGEKNTAPIAIPLHLDLKINSSQGPVKKEDYTCVAFIQHRGPSTEEGHYVSYYFDGQRYWSMNDATPPVVITKKEYEDQMTRSYIFYYQKGAAVKA